MDLKDLINKPLQDMTEEELMSKIRDIRLNRRTAATRKKAERSAAAESRSKKSAPKELNADQALELLKRLGVSDGIENGTT
jgi:hypothetical protein